jgi:cobalt/nickel transport system permease protein
VLGGVLAAVLVGPWAGCLCVAVMLMVQSLFADGGLTGLIRGHRPPRQPA